MTARAHQPKVEKPAVDVGTPSCCAFAFAAALVFFVPFILQYDYLINSFYHFGAPYNDAGILARVLWHGDGRLGVPHVFTNYSFFGVHFTLFFWPLSLLSRFLPTHEAEFYAGLLGCMYASLGLALFYAFYDCARPRTHWQLALLAVLCTAFAFNGIVMDGQWIGHFEYFTPLCIFLFLLHYLRGRVAPAVFFLICALSIREDSGLHLVAVLGLIAVVRFARTRSPHAVKREALIIAAAFAYSVFAVWMSLAARGYYSSTFELVYSGTPHWAHLTAALLRERAQNIFSEHIYLWLGFLITLFETIRTRNPYLIIGFAAYLPWFVVNWIAHDDNAGNLRAYYAFPFTLSLMWPLIAALLRYGYPLPAPAVRQAVWMQAALVAASVVMWNGEDTRLEFGPVYGARWGAYTLQDDMESRERLRDFVAQVDAGVGDLGNVMMDDGVQSLSKGYYKGRDTIRVEVDKPADTLLYFEPDPGAPHDVVLEKARKNHLAFHYCMTGTVLCVFTDRSPQQLSTLAPLLAPRPFPTETSDDQ